MDNEQNSEQVLAALKSIRNTFDTIGVECGFFSRNAIDVWVEFRENKDDFVASCFAKDMKHKINSLRSLLYSIDKYIDTMLLANHTNPVK